MCLPPWLVCFKGVVEGADEAADEAADDLHYGVEVDGIISRNDGDVCNAMVTQKLLRAAELDLSGARPLCCLDIGVDQGWWSAFCLRYSNANVISFEPNPISFKALQARWGQEPRVTLIPKAVSSSPTPIPFTLEEGCSHSRDSSGQLVPVTTLDFVFEANSYVDMIKIDTEGHEWSIFPVLEPYLPRIGAIVFEFSTYWYGSNQSECLSRGHQMLTRIFEEFPYVYYLSRNGFPFLIQLKTEESLEEMVRENYFEHHQMDILGCRIPLLRSEPVAEP